MPSPPYTVLSPTPTSTNQSLSQQVSASAGQSTSSSGSYTGPSEYTASLMRDSYKTAIDIATGNYSNILGGYANILSNMQGASDRLGLGYQSLGGQVQGAISGVEAAQRRAISDEYARASGSTLSSSVSRGLGNSTVLDSLQRGNLADKQKADVELSSSLANTRAGYMASLGGQSLSAQQALAQQMGSIGGQYLAVLGGQKAPEYNWAPNTSRSSSNSASAQQAQSTSTSQSLGTSQPSTISVPGVGLDGPQGGIQNYTTTPLSNPVAGQSPFSGYAPYNPFGSFAPPGGFGIPAGAPPLSVYTGH